MQKVVLILALILVTLALMVAGAAVAVFLLIILIVEFGGGEGIPSRYPWMVPGAAILGFLTTGIVIWYCFGRRR
jgi:hypothetical protein